MTKKIKLAIINFILVITVFSNFSYGVFTPNVYQSEDKKILAYAELSAATVTLASGQRVHATNINGDTQMSIDVIKSPIKVVLTIDTSGSMDMTGTNLSQLGNFTQKPELDVPVNNVKRIDAAKESAKLLVENLFDVAENVTVSVIGFSSSITCDITSSDKEEILKAIERITSEWWYRYVKVIE